MIFGEADALTAEEWYMAAAGEAGALRAGGGLIMRKQAVTIRLLMDKSACRFCRIRSINADIIVGVRRHVHNKSWVLE